MRRALMLALLAPLACAVDAQLDLPELVVPGVVAEGQVRVTDPPAGIADVQLPAVDGLTWIAPNITQSETSIVNGHATTVVTRRIRLRADREGVIAIPSVTVQLADGSAVTTAATTLKAGKGDARLSGEAYAEAAFEPTTIVAGQPCTLIYRIYVNGAARLRSMAVEPPTDAIKLGERAEQQLRTIGSDGRQWGGVEYRWPVTFAQPGEHRAGGGQQEYELGAADDVFGFGRVVVHRVAVKPATLTVAALPSAGRPDDFHGVIGPASISATLDRARISVGEGATLTLAISGRQIDLEPRPALPPLPGVTAYPRDVPATGDGARRFAWDLVPSAAGTIAIPSLSIAYFDADARAYRHASSQPLTLAVLPGREQRLAVTGKAAPPEESTPTTLTAPRLPAPLGADAPRLPPPAAPLASFAGMVCVGALVAIARDRRRRGPREPDQGRLLGRAVAAGDLDGAARALQALTLRLGSDAARGDAQRLAALIDLARFGGASLADEARAIAERLERA